MHVRASCSAAQRHCLETLLNPSHSTRRVSGALLALIAPLLGCSAFSDLENTAELGVNRTAYILDEAITSIDNNSADW